MELDRGCLVDTAVVVDTQGGWVEVEVFMGIMGCQVDINRDLMASILASAVWEDTGCNLHPAVCMDPGAFRDKEARVLD